MFDQLDFKKRYKLPTKEYRTNFMNSRSSIHSSPLYSILQYAKTSVLCTVLPYVFTSHKFLNLRCQPSRSAVGDMLNSVPTLSHNPTPWSALPMRFHSDMLFIICTHSAFVKSPCLVLVSSKKIHLHLTFTSTLFRSRCWPQAWPPVAPLCYSLPDQRILV